VSAFGRSSLYNAALIRFRASHIAEVDQAAFPRPWPAQARRDALGDDGTYAVVVVGPRQQASR
jgi:hypothetical protein